MRATEGERGLARAAGVLVHAAGGSVHQAAAHGHSFLAEPLRAPPLPRLPRLSQVLPSQALREPLECELCLTEGGRATPSGRSTLPPGPGQRLLQNLARIQNAGRRLLDS